MASQSGLRHGGWLVLLLTVFSAAHAQVEQWVARYTGPEAAAMPLAIAVDDKGNSYVTGWSRGVGTGYDYATVKYDSEGNEVWVARYNGPANWDDIARAVAVDVEGNVYVTGGSYGLGTGEDYATIKYDRDGNELWVARYDGPGSRDDVAQAIVVDAEGHVYVTGFSYGGYTQDYATIKYDADGTRIWVERYSGGLPPGGGAGRIGLDNEGNVYVTGGVWMGPPTYDDIATLKYNSEGQLLWVALYNGPGSGNDAPHDLRIDSEGYVYVTGESMGVGTLATDYVTIKYDSEGNEVWAALYDGPAHETDIAFALAVDVEGNVYVTGGSYGLGTGWDHATIKYDRDGCELWVSRYDGPDHRDDEAIGLGLDSESNVYVAGNSDSLDTQYDYATVKYDRDGNEVWVTRYDGPTHQNDFARAMAIDPKGNVYVAGDSPSGFSRDYTTVKYSPK